jgi:hypothetical protein
MIYMSVDKEKNQQIKLHRKLNDSCTHLPSSAPNEEWTWIGLAMSHSLCYMGMNGMKIEIRILWNKQPRPWNNQECKKNYIYFLSLIYY